jgi:hypothetical protein
MRLGGGTCVDDFPAKPQPFTSRTIFARLCGAPANIS